MLIDCITIGSWNINGISNKINDPNFIAFIKSNHITFLLETFSDKDTEPIAVDGFTCKNVSQSNKHKAARRNSGGISVLIRNELSPFIKIIKVTAEHFVWLKINKSLTGLSRDLFCGGAYIQPKDSPIYLKQPDLDLFALLGNDINKFKHEGHILFTGDLNARIGLSQDCPQEHFSPIDDDPISYIDIIDVPERSSMDSTKNPWGSNLLDICYGHELCLLNGRTLGDLRGKFTFFSKKGSSAIDVTVVDKQLFSSILSFQVDPINEFSSHSQIRTKLACKTFNHTINNTTTDELKFKKYFWNPDSSKDKLSTALQSEDFISLKNQIIQNTYSTDKSGVDKLTADVVSLSTLLHEKTCNFSDIGKKNKNKRKKQSWFTPDCESLRKRVRRAGNYLNRHPFNRQAREDYFVAKRQYNRKIKQTKKTARELGISNLIKSLDKREMWSQLAELRGGKKSNTPIEMDEIHNHFKKVLNSPKNLPKEKLDLIQEKLGNYLNDRLPPTSSLVKGYEEEFVIKMGKTLKNGKSAFTDGIINEIIKHSISDMSPIYCKLFNHIEISAEFPYPWKSSFLVPLHKKGPADLPDNYRGLAVGSNLCKFFTKCFNEKLKTFCDENNLLAPQQFGFREDFRTQDAISVLRSVTSYYKNSKRPVYACFVDFSKAFDSVFRPAMLYKLGKIGIKGTILKLIQNMYQDCQYIIKNNGLFSKPINSSIGVKQGCNLSPLLFNIFINDIHDIFNSSCDPLDIDSLKLSSLSFADDLVILSESPGGLQNSLDALNKYCENWGLVVNASKTKVVTFNKPFNKKIRNQHFTIGTNQIEVQNSYCYLGIEISNTGNFSKANEKLYKKAIKAQYSIFSSINVYSDEPNIPLFLRLFDSLLKPILLYSSEIWGTCKPQQKCKNGDFDTQKISSNIKNLDKFVNKFYRILLGVPNTCSTIGTHMELGRLPIKLNIFKSMLKFWFRLVTLPKSRLVSHCYWALLKQPNIQDDWINSIKHIIGSSGFCHFWNDQEQIQHLNPKEVPKIISLILKSFEDQFLQNAHSEISAQNKLHLFKDIPQTLEVATHLTALNTRKKRSLFTKLRLGTLKLEIETGRWDKTNKNERFCKLCTMNRIENESHFLFDCPALTLIRNPLLHDIYTIHPELAHLPSEIKIRRLFFNEKLDQPTLDLASTLLLELTLARDKVLNNK